MPKVARIPRWAVAAGLALAVAAVVVLVVALAGDDDTEPRKAAGDAAPAPAPRALISRPDLRPPAVAVDVAPASRGDGVVFVSPRMEQPARDKATHQQGALGLDDQGRALWFRPAPDGEPITDVRPQRYRGRPVLTWWQGAATKFGIGRGEGVIVDQAYRTVATVQAGNGRTIDLHEFRLTPRGTALVTIYGRARRDLTAVGGKRDGQVTQGIVQEIDVASGRVLFEWESLDDVPVTETVRKPQPAQDSFDYFHINSVDEAPNGDFIVSARHTSAIYRISRRTGRVVWRLGGERSDFRLGPGVRFALQHDAHPLGDGRLLFFDNGPDDGRDRPSSAKVLRLDTRTMRATLERRLGQPDGMWAESQGNAQPLPGGGVMVGWGSTGAFSWFDAADKLRLDAHLPAEYDTYRAYMAPWVGRPRTRPAIALRREDPQVTVTASWNGATEVRAWQVLAGARPDALRPVGAPARWAGLETAIVRATKARFVAVAALDGRGRTLRTSRPVGD